MDLKKPVSGRQFAKMVGQSEGAVRKAVSRNSILKGVTADGKYIPEIAAAEWGKKILPEFLKPQPAKTKAVKLAPQKKTPEIKIEKKLKPDDIIKGILDEEYDDEFKFPEIDDDEIEDGPLNENSSKAEAERKLAIYKAQIMELGYQEKKGEMIPKSKLKVLFEYGAQIRSSFESLPDKLLDEILANADDRQVAKRIFVEGIHETLTNLSDPEKLNL